MLRRLRVLDSSVCPESFVAHNQKVTFANRKCQLQEALPEAVRVYCGTCIEGSRSEEEEVINQQHLKMPCLTMMRQEKWTIQSEEGFNVNRSPVEERSQ